MDMREIRQPREQIRSAWGAAALVAAPFLLGGVLGIFACRGAAAGGSGVLADYIGAYVQASLEGGSAGPGFLFLLWENLRYPLAALILGFTALGLVGLPALLFLRGFLAAFALTAFTAVYGAVGPPLGFLLMGVSDLVSIPALFLLGVEGMGTAGQMLTCLTQGRRPAGVFSPQHWICSAGAIGAVMLWSGAVSLMHPVLISLAAKLVT